jgi:ubiquinone/menaquinone biosynthesis C-methylase UbiE
MLQGKVLNVGGNSKAIELPPQYAGFEHVLLDIDPAGNPDIVCDARELMSLQPNSFEAVYCSHNLEHYYAHDVPKVLAGFIHVMKPDGFAQIRVPDLQQLMQRCVADQLDMDAILYQSSVGPIRVLDVIYGHAEEIEQSGEDFYAHKTGFTARFLYKTLQDAGFSHIYCTLGNLEINAVALAQAPTQTVCDLFNIRDS